MAKPPGDSPVQAAKPITFQAFSETRAEHWAHPASYSFVAGLSQLPIADSELLLTSHHLPIAIDNIHDEPRVIALTSPRFQKQPVVSKSGAWLKGYMPIALRCLPFRFNPAQPGKAILEIATDIPHDGKLMPMRARDGGPSAEVRKVVALLTLLDRGKAALREAAERLLIADVVAPFHLARLPEGHTARRQFFTVDRNRFAALTPSRAALLTADSFLPVDLAAACIFSQRLMATLIEFAGASGSASPDHRPAVFDAFTIVDQIDLAVDDAELFSFDRFAQTTERLEGLDGHSLRSQ